LFSRERPQPRARNAHPCTAHDRTAHASTTHDRTTHARRPALAQPTHPAMTLRVAILYNDDQGLAHGEAKDALATQGVLHEAQAVAQACRDNRWEPVAFAVPADPRVLLSALAEARADVVFNLAEAVGGEARLEAAVAWLLEWARIPYTGSGPLALSLALDKPLAKALLASRGVPVARGCVIERTDEPLADAAGPLRPPLIVKPAREDASHGIGLDSVVHGEREARARARYILERYRQPALVEEFAGGREFNVSIVGEGTAAVVLPLGEIDFSAFPAGRPPLVTYEAKWVEDSPEYRGTPSVAARPMASALEAQVRGVALAAYGALGLRDYGRVDLRLRPAAVSMVAEGAGAENAGAEEAGGEGVGAPPLRRAPSEMAGDGSPVVLEVNPNPDISPDAGLARAALRAGGTYVQLIARIVEGCLARAATLRPGTAPAGPASR
jgi:D-alanine-D-alanine ligase